MKKLTIRFIVSHFKEIYNNTISFKKICVFLNQSQAMLSQKIVSRKRNFFNNLK